MFYYVAYVSIMKSGSAMGIVASMNFNQRESGGGLDQFLGTPSVSTTPEEALYFHLTAMALRSGKATYSLST